MSRKRNKLPPFVALTWKMLNAPAYKDLPGSAAKALPYFLGKVKYVDFRDAGRYSEPFQFPYGEAESLGFSRTTFFRVICELVEKGFIDPVVRGGLRGRRLSYNKFKLSARWEIYRRFDFRKVDWKKIVR